MSPVKHLFIVNPVAGRGISLRMARTIDRLFKELRSKYSEIDYEIVYTKHEGHATEIARDFSSMGDYRIYAVGGDGTLNEVLNGMVGTGSTLACIPGGSGNDFIKSFVPKFDRNKILRDTILGVEQDVDLGVFDDRFFLNIASLGFDANVVKNAERYKDMKMVPAKLSYMLGIVNTAMDFKTEKVRLVIDGVETFDEVFMIAVANGKYYGGGIKIAPLADFTDGLLDILIVKDIDRAKILKFFPKALAGEHVGLDEVTFIRAKQIEIFSDEPIYMNIDGELRARKDVVIRVADEKVKMVFPRGVAIR